MKAIRTAPAAIVATPYFGSRFPKMPLIAKPAAGNRGIAQMRSRKFMRSSPLHEVDFVDVHRFLVLEHGNDDAQAHGGFGGRHGNYKNGKNLAGDLLQTPRERDQV